GLVGFVLGDYFLFASYSIIMARFSQLIMTLAPPFAAIFGFILLGEKMSWIAGGRRCIERWGSDLVFYLMNRGDAVKIINKIQ
ncbi:MAG: EamA family transporter, partial [Bacteroidales bacterium]